MKQNLNKFFFGSRYNSFSLKLLSNTSNWLKRNISSTWYSINWKVGITLSCWEDELGEVHSFVYSVDLVVKVFLTWAFWGIYFSPFSETSCDLFASNWWIFTVISVPDCQNRILVFFFRMDHHVGAKCQNQKFIFFGLFVQMKAS